MWHLQVHHCEDQLQELELSSQQLLQASSEQVSSHCARFSGHKPRGIHFWLALTCCCPHLVTLCSTHSCLLARYPQAQSPQLSSSVSVVLIKSLTGLVVLYVVPGSSHCKASSGTTFKMMYTAWLPLDCFTCQQQHVFPVEPPSGVKDGQNRLLVGSLQDQKPVHCSVCSRDLCSC